MKDEQGRPFIVVKEYVTPILVPREPRRTTNKISRRLTESQSRKEEEAAWQRRSQIPHLGGENCSKYSEDIIGEQKQRVWKRASDTKLNIIKGPRGLDKILISPDGDITVTNDGATILSQVR